MNTLTQAIELPLWSIILVFALLSAALVIASMRTSAR